MLLAERILAAAGHTPDAPAFIVQDQAMTYRQMHAVLARTIMHLRSVGIERDIVVGLTMSQAPLHLLTVVALGWLGAVVVPLSPFLRVEERNALIARFGVRVTVSDRNEPPIWGVRQVGLISIGATGHETIEAAGPSAAEPGTPFRIALTSGTTGLPKGVLQTHASFVERMDRMHCDVVDVPRLLPANLHVTLALNLAMYVLCKGGAVVFPRGYANGDFFEALRRHAVTHVALPPSHLNAMLGELRGGGGPAFPAIRHLRLLGSTPTPAFLDHTRRRFSTYMYLPYGIGEIGVVSMATPEMLLDEPGSAGRLEPGVRLETLDNGEIRVAIPGMPSAYHGPDAGDHTRFRDGWFYPGDRGSLSPAGLVFLEGRSDDLINVGGRKAAPQYVEAVLSEFPGVLDVGVHPVDDGDAGTRIGAVIVAVPGLDWEKLRAFAAVRLEVHAPVSYRTADSLPRNAMGKLVREKLASLPAAPAP